MILQEKPVRPPIWVFLFAISRTVFNTSYRMVYPFLPVIARGLGVELSSITLILTTRSAVGLFAPLFGSAGDLWGRKRTMLVSTAIFTASLGLVTLWPTYPALFIALVLSTAAKILFDPAMQAYIGDRIHYRGRGLAIAISEMGWSGATLIGIPIVGWVIARSGWHAPFAWLSAAGLVSGVLLWNILPKDIAVEHDARPSFRENVAVVLAHPAALAGLGVTVITHISNESVNIVFGAWLENAFGLQVVALGAATAVIGISELMGEGLVATITDRLGKQRSVMLGMVLNTLAFLTLPVVSQSLFGALAGLFFLYITFEFMIVSLVPLLTELTPAARATLMAGYGASVSGGRLIGSLLGPFLFTVGAGLSLNAVISAVLQIGALVLLALLVKHE